ncbi:MAG TPA: metal-dependent hydrolase [Thermoplasmata archaeon]|jgi:TatD-related deoxyribonuclease|nr:metal-dependent hydrolase [Thermoplasmata archaeon]
MICFDNHLHLRRDGRFLEAVKEFKAAGGTHFILCQYPMPETVLKEKSYQTCYQETIHMAEEIRSTLDIGVFVVVGPYPVDLLPLQERFGRQTALSIMRKGMDEAANLCREHLCIAIGEIGRPHFPVDQQIIQDSNDLLAYGMAQAKDAGVPVVLHTESTTPKLCEEFVEMGRKVGLNPERIVKHFAPPLITPEENFGLMPSVLSSRKNIVAALQKGTRFLMETDYIDDLRRPGAVLAPRTVPKLTKNLLQENLLSEKHAHVIHVENPKNTYHIDLEE